MTPSLHSSYEIPRVPLIPGTENPNLTRQQRFTLIGQHYLKHADVHPEAAQLAENAFAIARKSPAPLAGAVASSRSGFRSTLAYMDRRTLN